MSEHIVKAPHVPPFVTFVTSAVPMVFDNSLSYYEALCALWKWLQDDVVNVINNNATVTEDYIDLTNEYTQKFIELKEYVDTYFDNLDVQEEINNKLDEMAEDGTLQEMVASVLHLSYTYNTFEEFYADTQNHQAGAIVRTLGHSTVNDKRGATYLIVDSEPSTAYEALPNSLYALVINNEGIRRENTPNQNYFYLDSERLYGVNKSDRNLIEQEADKECTIEAQHNECSLERLSLQNTNNYSNKTGIKVDTPAQRFYANSIFIRGNSTTRYATGLDIPTAYYSYFNDMFITGETGVKIGQPNDQTAWVGVLDFNSCHINGCDLAVRQYSKDTNTICFDKCSFENNIKSLENDGIVYVKNTYFGDNKEDTGEVINVAVANAGSETYFNDSTVSMVATSHTSPNVREGLIKLKSSSGVGSKVFIKGGLINISNNTYSNSSSSIYDTDSNLNQIYLDYVKFVPSTQNLHHNRSPYYLYEGYSPLRSLEPITNYVINGTMNDDLGNTFLYVDSSRGSLDASLTNPFGGKVSAFQRSGSGSGYTNFYYQIPKELVGKKMTLELYALSSSNKLDITSSELGLNSYETYLSNASTSDNKRVMLFRKEVTPSADKGTIRVFIHWNDTTTDAWYFISGLVLKENKYHEMLSCYKDQNIRMSKTIPVNTTYASKGDIVYASPDSTSGVLGWIYDGSSWRVYQPYSA